MFMIKEAYDHGFADEMEKIGFKEKTDESGNLTPGYWKGAWGATKSMFKSPKDFASAAGHVYGGEIGGAIGGAAGGSVLGAGTGALLALAKRNPAAIKSSAATGSLIGGTVGALGGMTFGGVEGSRIFLGKRGIKGKNMYILPRYTFSPEAQEKYNVHPKKKD